MKEVLKMDESKAGLALLHAVQVELHQVGQKPALPHCAVRNR